MIDFKPVALADRELLLSYIWPSSRRDNNLSVANLCSWQFLTCSSYAIIHDQLVLRFCFSDQRTVYTTTATCDAAVTVVRSLAHQAADEGLPLYLYGIIPDLQDLLDRAFPDVFEYRENRDHFDYLYVCSDLAKLQGKGYQTKRNHVNKFRKKYDYRYTPMTLEMVSDCIHLYDEWCAERHCEGDESLTNERQALLFGMEHFRELGLQGGVLWVDNQIIAFTYGAPVNHDTFCIHAEKALTFYEGAYNVINQEFASRLCSEYTYINREEDLGVAGLRKAKLSYRPVILLKKGLAVCAEGIWEKLF